MSTIPVAGETFTFGVCLADQANALLFKAAPTIAVSDFQISTNGGAFANLANLPTVTPAAGVQVQIVISAAETTAAGAGGRLLIWGKDASGDEWASVAIELRVESADIALSGAEMDLINAPNATAVTALQAGLATAAALAAVTVALTGAAVAGTLSATQMTTDLTEATDDHFNGRVVIWTSGVLKDQAAAIQDYDGASKMLTYTTCTEAPGAADTFVIV